MAGKKVTLDFTAPELSSLGGLTLVREYEKSSSRIIERIESCIRLRFSQKAPLMPEMISVLTGLQHLPPS